MKLIKTAAAVINQTPFDWSGNTTRLTRLINEAKTKGVSLLCLPELCISGYGCEDAFYMPHFIILQRPDGGIQRVTISDYTSHLRFDSSRLTHEI